MALLHACSGGSGLGAAAAAAGSKPGYVTGTGQYVVVNDAVPNGGNAFTNQFSGELYTPLMPIAPTTDWRWVNGFFRMPGAGNVILAWHHWATAAFQSYALIYNPWLTSLYLQAFTRPNTIGAVLQGPFVENCAGYRPFSWGVNSNPASPGYRDTTLILWDRVPPTVFANFNPGAAYNPPPLPSPTHQGAFFNPTYQRNLIYTDELDDGTGRFVGAIDVRNYPMLSAIPNGNSLQGSQLFVGWDGAAPQAADFGWWDEVPVTTAGWPDQGDSNYRGAGPGPSHSTFPVAAPPGGTEVAAVVMYDHRNSDAANNFFSIYTSEGQSTQVTGILNRTSQLYTPDQWNIRDPGFGNPWNDAIFNTLAAGYQDQNILPHMQLHLEVVYGPVVEFQIVEGAAVLSGAGALAAAAYAIASGASALSGAGALSGDGLGIAIGSAPLTGAGNLSGAALLIVPAAALLTGLGALSAVGVRVAFATVWLDSGSVALLLVLDGSVSLPQAVNDGVISITQAQDASVSLPRAVNDGIASIMQAQDGSVSLPQAVNDGTISLVPLLVLDGSVSLPQAVNDGVISITQAQDASVSLPRAVNDGTISIKETEDATV